MPFTEDLSIFLADFGVVATLAGRSVRGIFDQPTGTQLDMTASEPQFQLRTADVPAAIFGTTLVIPNEGSFTVREALPDGTGMSLLLLTRVSS